MVKKKTSDDLEVTLKELLGDSKYSNLSRALVLEILAAERTFGDDRRLANDRIAQIIEQYLDKNGAN